MSDGKVQAQEILNKLGASDGQKHITQLLYFAEGVGSRTLLTYWKDVEKEFKDAVNNNTPDQKVRPWLPR